MHLNRLLQSFYILSVASSISSSTAPSTSDTRCRRFCNGAVKEAENIGRIPKLCEIDSLVSTELGKCQNCTLTADVGMNSTKDYINLQPYINYCASLKFANNQNMQTLYQRSNTSERFSTVSSVSITKTTSDLFNGSHLPTGTSERFIKETLDATVSRNQNSTSNFNDAGKHDRRWEILAFALPVGILFLTACWIIFRSRYHDRVQPRPRPRVKTRDSIAGKPELASQNWMRFELGASLRRVPELFGILKPVSELHSVEDQIFELSPEEKSVFELPAIEPACLELPTYFETANPSDLILIHATHLRV